MHHKVNLILYDKWQNVIIDGHYVRRKATFQSVDTDGAPSSSIILLSITHLSNTTKATREALSLSQLGH